MMCLSSRTYQLRQALRAGTSPPRQPKGASESMATAARATLIRKAFPASTCRNVFTSRAPCPLTAHTRPSASSPATQTASPRRNPRRRANGTSRQPPPATSPRSAPRDPVLRTPRSAAIARAPLRLRTKTRQPRGQASSRRRNAGTARAARERKNSWARKAPAQFGLANQSRRRRVSVCQMSPAEPFAKERVDRAGNNASRLSDGNGSPFGKSYGTPSISRWRRRPWTNVKPALTLPPVRAGSVQRSVRAPCRAPTQGRSPTSVPFSASTSRKSAAPPSGCTKR